MTADEALNLAQRITSRWRGTATRDAWTAALEPLPHQPALAAFAHYAKTTGDPGPTIHRFTERVQMDTPTNVVPLGRRLTREERLAILTANGAPQRLCGHNPKENP